MPHPPKEVLGVTPGMIGCAEAAEVLKIIGEYGEVLSGKLWTINVKTMETHLISFRGIEPALFKRHLIPQLCANSRGMTTSVARLRLAHK